MKYIKYIVAAVTLAIALTAFSFAPRVVTESAFLLDTYISVTVYDGDKDAAKAAVSCTEEIDRMLSAFAADSEISKINHAPRGTAVPVSDACFSLISRALFLSEQTDGAFDITVKPVMDLWDFGGTPTVPEKKELALAVEKVNYRAVLLDDIKKTVILQKDGMAIDLGGIAKGYAADCAMEVLKNAGVQNACLDFGGNVVTMGEMPLSLIDRIKHGAKSRPFAIGIQNPNEARGTVSETVLAQRSPCAIVTSGGYERNFTENGTTYHHIINPKTGMQPDNGILSVTVVAASSETADALSTALFVSGEAGISRVSGLYDEIIFIMDNGEVKTFR